MKLVLALIPTVLFLINIGGWITLGFLRAKPDSNPKPFRVIQIVISVLCVFIMGCSYVFNIGWIRFILIMTVVVPIVHTGLFICANVLSSRFIKESSLLFWLGVVSNITFAVSYAFLPDGGDYGPMYVLFGLIHNNAVSNMFMLVAWYGFWANIAICILQIIFYGISRHNLKQNDYMKDI